MLDQLIDVATSIVKPNVIWPEMEHFVYIMAQIELYRVEAFERILKRAGKATSTSSSGLGDLERLRKADKSLREQYLGLIFMVKRAVRPKLYRHLCYGTKSRIFCFQVIGQMMLNGFPVDRMPGTFWPELSDTSCSLMQLASERMSASEAKISIMEREKANKDIALMKRFLNNEDISNPFASGTDTVKKYPWLDPSLNWMDKVKSALTRYFPEV